MRIGVASDSFGNLAALDRALGLFQRVQVDRVYFLGGRAADVDAVLTGRSGGSRPAPAPAPAPVPDSDGAFLVGALQRQANANRDPLDGRIIRVASRACPEYESGKVPRKQLDLLEGRLTCLVHDKAELDREDIANAALIFHGNAVAPGIVQIGPRCFVTPGHLRATAPAGRSATFAVVEVTERDLALTVFSDEGAELRKDRVSFSVTGKMSVR